MNATNDQFRLAARPVEVRSDLDYTEEPVSRAPRGSSSAAQGESTGKLVLKVAEE